MSKYSKDKLAEISAQIMRVMATHPEMSGRKIALRLGYEHHFIIKLKNKIHKQRVEEIKRMTVEEELAELNDLHKTLLPVIASIVFSDTAKDRDKISAMRALIDGKIKVLGTKFDAGIFEKQLGRVKVEQPLTDEQQEKIKNAIDFALQPRLNANTGGHSDKPDVA